jgi:hypothetical protein
VENKKLMISRKLESKVFLVALLALGVQVNSLVAQESRVLEPKNTALSVNPFGMMLDLFNAEIERVASPTSTIGFGGSGFFGGEGEGSMGDLEYINADIFWRYYPSGTPLQGWMFGVKTGMTSVDTEGTYWGYGFDFNRSWLLGPEGKFYMGIGFGLKRLYKTGGSSTVETLRYIPTFRLVNVGIAF